MRKIIFSVFIILPAFVSAQSQKFFQLEYGNKPFFKEMNYLFFDSGWRFVQTLKYDQPNVYDEEVSNTLTIEIKDSVLLRAKKTVDVIKDSSTVKSNFVTVSAWTFDNVQKIISGTVELKEITDEGIKLKLDITVIHPKTMNQYIFSGERMFYKRPNNKLVIDK